MKIYISHSGSYDYETELYRPIKESIIFADRQIFLPHEGDKLNIKTKDIIKSFDLMIAEVSYPSTGQGIEIGLAAAANVPIVCLCKSDAKLSSALRFYAADIIEYQTPQELVERIQEYVQSKGEQ